MVKCKICKLILTLSHHQPGSAFTSFINKQTSVACCLFILNYIQQWQLKWFLVWLKDSIRLCVCALYRTKNQFHYWYESFSPRLNPNTFSWCNDLWQLLEIKSALWEIAVPLNNHGIPFYNSDTKRKTSMVCDGAPNCKQGSISVKAFGKISVKHANGIITKTCWKT